MQKRDGIGKLKGQNTKKRRNRKIKGIECKKRRNRKIKGIECKKGTEQENLWGQKEIKSNKLQLFQVTELNQRSTLSACNDIYVIRK